VGNPKLSISECTTYTATFESDLCNYRLAGADGIGIWEFKLGDGDDLRAADQLQKSGLRATLCVPEVPSIVPDPFFTEPKDPLARRAALCVAVRRLSRFDPVAVLCLTGDPAGRDRAEMRRLVIDGLRAAAEVAGEAGVTLGLEPLRASSGSLVTTIPDTLDLIGDIGAENVKVIADTWHFWDVPGMLRNLRTYADRLVGVQVNDYREPTRSWCDRVLPGDGVIDLPAVFAALDDGGFEGWYDVEVFSDNGLFGNSYPDSLWSQDPRQVAEAAVRKFRAAWDGRGSLRQRE
jgi:sugar phosphate isomerase/epimerase